MGDIETETKFRAEDGTSLTFQVRDAASVFLGIQTDSMTDEVVVIATRRQCAELVVLMARWLAAQPPPEPKP